MKSYIKVVVLSLIIAIMPALVTAQTYSFPNSDQSTSNEDEWGRWYRRGGSDLQQKISGLSNTSVTSVSIPVLFGVALKNISPNFGDPRSGGRKHAGEDIMAVKGTPIVSPTEAVVLRVGVGPSEGNYVYTANPGGETFVYMHLDRIGEGVVSGTVLGRGSLIGYVGNTGNASGGAAHLHFEIHNSAGTPIDPFPRLSSEFSVQEKMNALTAIFTQTTDSASLSNFLVSTFRPTFTTALAQNIAVPQLIIGAMASASASSSGGSPSVIPAGDLSVGSSGSQVTTLQKYLIAANKGPAAIRLRAAGATGYFGDVTRTALFEYQIAVGITPPNGYYGADTRTYILGHPLPGTPTSTSTPAPNATTPRDLSRNMTGEDVRTLQKRLNAKGFLVAMTGAGSPGNETSFFGPATETAVKKFQNTYGIAPASGVVNAGTRTALESF